MGTDEQKGEVELKFFREFAILSGEPLDAISAEKRLPPEPDVLCKHQKEGLVAFELVEVCDPNIAQMTAKLSKTEGGVAHLRTSDPSRPILSKKLNKEYETAYPIELLCYTNGRVITPPDVIVPTILPIIRSMQGPFRRIWLLANSKNQRVVQLVWETNKRN